MGGSCHLGVYLHTVLKDIEQVNGFCPAIGPMFSMSCIISRKDGQTICCIGTGASRKWLHDTPVTGYFSNKKE